MEIDDRFEMFPDESKLSDDIKLSDFLKKKEDSEENKKLIEELTKLGHQQFKIEQSLRDKELEKKHRIHRINQKALQKKSKKKRK